ncbi:MAG: PQQ-binding-like beta-propeller repeat protein [Thermoplasmata archaeon]|nr:PQQ-binding-like beta-propeller repeat protein [Thermoplasmata archaeon]
MPRPGVGVGGRRSRWVALGLLAVLALLSVALVPPGPTPGAPLTLSTRPVVAGPIDWTTFHGGQNRSGFVPTNGPAQGNTAFITCQGAGGNASPIRVGPVANATRVFVADALGHVYAYNTTGVLEWTTAGPTDPTTADLLAPFLILGGGDGTVTAYAADSGTVVWNVNLGGRIVQGIADDGARVYVGTTTGTLAAIDVATGHIDWRLALGNGVAGAPALEGNELFVATGNGTVLALGLDGTLLWSHSVGAPMDSAPAVSYGAVILGDRSANITALSTGNGSELWQFPGYAALHGDVIESTPAVGDGGVFVVTDLGRVLALSARNGSLRWAHPLGYTGYPVLSSPALGFNAVYLVDANEFLDAYTPGTGQLLWSSNLFSSAVYSSPALERGLLYVGNEVGCLTGFGRPGFTGPVEPVTGIVTDRNGTPIAGAQVGAGVAATTTDRHGRYLLNLSNGTYDLTAGGAGYPPVTKTVVVAGPLAGVDFVLRPPAFYRISGTVVDSRSGHPLVGVVVVIEGEYGYVASNTTGSLGLFALAAPNGSNFVSVDPPQGYVGLATHVDVSGGPVSAIALQLDSSAPAFGDPTSGRVAILLPLAGLALGAVGYYVVDSQRRRKAEGLPPAILTPIARFVLMRTALLPVQVVGALLILYVFGTYLTSEAYGFSPSALFTSPGPTACLARTAWSNPVCAVTAFGEGFGSFIWNLFTLNWGLARFGHLSLPATQFLAWWAPDSIELAVVALGLSAAIAYVVGLLAGWRRESAFDFGARTGSIIGLLIPTFLVLLLFDETVSTPVLHALGDSPFGILPSQFWFASHGGPPAWIGQGNNTEPSGFPLVDGLLHGAWTFELIVLTKTLLQAAVIALVYVAIFLRYARHAVASAVREPFVVAARARGLDEPTLLWHHTARRVLPLFVLIFGITLPVYIGTQALVEALSNDTGIGTLLLGEITQVGLTGFGISTGGTGPPVGNFYQVTVFMLVILILVGNLAADVLARYLDPRLVAPNR